MNYEVLNYCSTSGTEEKHQILHRKTQNSKPASLFIPFYSSQNVNLFPHLIVKKYPSNYLNFLFGSRLHSKSEEKMCESTQQIWGKFLISGSYISNCFRYRRNFEKHVLLILNNLWIKLKQKIKIESSISSR